MHLEESERARMIRELNEDIIFIKKAEAAGLNRKLLNKL